MKILLMLLIVSAGALSVLQARAESCERKIIFLPEYVAARNPMNPGPVALSQFMVLQALKENPGAPVFSENIDQDLSAEDLQDQESDVLPEFKQIFPKGIPDNFEKLNLKQRNTLAKRGGDLLALATGDTSNLYAAMNGHTELKSMVERERKALGEIKAYFGLYPEVKTAILVMSAQFDLTRHSDIFPPECIVVPAAIHELVTN